MSQIPDSSPAARWSIFVAVGMGVFLATIDGSIVNVALPTLVRDFQTSFAVIQWVALAYMLTIATLILSMGRLGDTIGKKKIYLSGMTIFTLGSVLCGFAQTVQLLIIFRIFQASGAAMMAALGVAIVTEVFPAKERGKALGSIGGIVSIGIIAGPTLGGILIDALSWHWIFFVNLPIGVLGIIMVISKVPDFRPVGKQKFDLAGAAVLFFSVLILLMALTLGQTMGFKHPFIVSLFVTWIFTFLLFIYVEVSVADPMIDLTIFRNYRFTLNLFTGFLTFVALSGITLLMPFYLENVLNYSPHQVGLFLAIIPLAAGITSPLSGMLSDRLGTRTISAVGLLLLLLGYISLTSLNESTTAWGYILRFLPVGLGIGIFQSPNNSAIMGTAPNRRLGVISGMLAITRTMGQTAGIAILGAFWAARVAYYSNQHISAVHADTLVAAQVAGLQDTITGTVLIIGFALLLSLWAAMLALVRRKIRISKYESERVTNSDL
jgi:EmrB/QacA subfamily drug resistance transporter